MNKRERDLQQCLVSTVAGAFIAILLCALLPGIGTKIEAVYMMFILWFIATWTVWEGIVMYEEVKKWRSTRSR